MRLFFLANAASVHTERWVRYFAQAGNDVHLVTWRPPRERGGLDRVVKVHRVVTPPHHALRYATFAEVLRIVRRVRPDLVHAHYLAHFGIVGGLLGRFADVRPLVLTAWGTDVLMQCIGLRQRLIRMAIRQADCVTCDSPHMALRLVDLGALPSAVRIVNFGVDTDRFRPGLPDRDVRSHLGLGHGPIVVSLRNLKRVYDVATLVRAVPAVVEAVPRASFVIAGDGPERPALEALAASLGVAGRVQFVGALAHEAMPSWLNSADVYVSTSRSDAGIAASTAEAMACGLPAVVTDFGDNASWVRDGESGYTFPCGDERTLADRLTVLLQDPRLRQRMGANGRREIVERNSYQVEMQVMEGIYLDLVEGYGR